MNKTKKLECKKVWCKPLIVCVQETNEQDIHSKNNKILMLANNVVNTGLFGVAMINIRMAMAMVKSVPADIASASNTPQHTSLSQTIHTEVSNT